MKVSKEEVSAVAAAETQAKKAITKAKKPRKTAAERKREEEQRRDLWLQATKIIVPAWFGNCSVSQGFKLGNTFTAAGVLALVSVGLAGRSKSHEGKGHECEVGMQMRSRPNGFDRQEARDLAARGFAELRHHKLVKLSMKNEEQPQLQYYKLTAKGQKWFDLLERSAGCAAQSDEDDE